VCGLGRSFTGDLNTWMPCTLSRAIERRGKDISLTGELVRCRSERLDLRKMLGHMDRVQRLKQRWPARLISAVAMVMLLWTSAIGAYAHALGHHHHHHDGGHGTHKHALAGQAVASPDGQDQGSAAQPGPTERFCCCDVICHGGYAILQASSMPLAPVRPRAERVPTERAEGTQPPSLDRPPRSPVRA